MKWKHYTHSIRTMFQNSILTSFGHYFTHKLMPSLRQGINFNTLEKRPNNVRYTEQTVQLNIYYITSEYNIIYKLYINARVL